MFKLLLEKAEEPEIKLPISAGSKKQESSRKTSIYAVLTMLKPIDCVDHNKLWKILKEKGIPDHLTCLLRNLYAGQEAIVRTSHRTTDWFQIGKGVHQVCILSPCLFNLYAVYLRWNARLEELQVGIKIYERNISNLRYAKSITDTMGMNLSKFSEIVEHRGAWHAAIHGVTKSQIGLREWTATTNKKSDHSHTLNSNDRLTVRSADSLQNNYHELGHLAFSHFTEEEIVQFCSVAQSCLTLCDPKNCSTPGLPVHH